MKRKSAKRLWLAIILFLLLVQAGCYSPAYYPSYGTDYGGAVPYRSSYPAPGYGLNDPGGYGRPGYPAYDGQDYGGQGYREDDDDDDDGDWDNGAGQNRRPWQYNPYGGYSGR